MEKMQVHCKFDVMTPIAELKPHPKNRNKHPDDQIDRLAKILAYQGVRAPIVVSEQTGFIVKGHGTLLAIKANRWTSAPVVFQSFADDEQEYAFVQSDNAIASWAQLDLSGINIDLGDLGPDFDIDLLGIKNFTIEVAEEEDDRDGDAAPENVETRSQSGDIWLLGRHRMMCGDSTNVQHIDELMSGTQADMVLTDPPYGMHLDADYSGMQGKMGVKSGNKYAPVAGDNEDFSPELINTIFAALGYCKEMFIFGADYFAEHLPNRNEGSWIVWDKRLESQADGFGSEFEFCWSKQNHKRRVLRHDWFGFLSSKNAKDARHRLHPTQKPVTLLEDIMDQWGEDAKNIVDLYGGSGSTLIACEKSKRKCFIMELEPYYCDVILARWEKFTGKTAELDTRPLA